MPTTDFEDFLELEPPLRLPYGDTIYEIPPVSIQDALTLHLALDPDTPEAQLPGDRDLEKMLLGAAADLMRENRVPPRFVMRCLLTALADFQQGRDVAHMVWKTGADPKAVEAWIGARVASTLSTSTAGENETPSPASTRATTNSRPSSGRRTKQPATSPGVAS